MPCTTAMATRCWRRGSRWASRDDGRSLRTVENIIEPLGDNHTFPLRPVCVCVCVCGWCVCVGGGEISKE